MTKKFFWLILAVIMGAVLFLIGSDVLADLAGDPPSSQPNSNIQSWYDETWQASGFYNLERDGESNNFKYKYYNKDDLTNKATPYNGPNADPDLVVTEWDATGHVHFSSNL